jgi:DUF4097 and DUF4098 domain-containing protein YvlB
MKMRNRLMILFHSVLVATLLAGASALSVSAQEERRGQQDLPASEEIRRSFQLTPGTLVSIESISGPVDVEKASGQTAEVYIVRSAQSQRDLDCYRTIVEQTSAGLSIRNEQQCRNVRARQRVKVSLPTNVNLRIESVSGDVHIAAIDGSARLNSISGGVWMEQAGGDININSVSGSVNLNVVRLNTRGLRLNSISGRIMLRLADSINADVRVESISGEFSSEIPGVNVDKVGDSDFRAQVGSGGTPISISSVSGSVTLRRV